MSNATDDKTNEICTLALVILKKVHNSINKLFLFNLKSADKFYYTGAL